MYKYATMPLVFSVAQTATTDRDPPDDQNKAAARRLARSHAQINERYGSRPGAPSNLACVV